MDTHSEQANRSTFDGTSTAPTAENPIGFLWLSGVVIADLIYLYMTHAVLPAAVVFSVTAYMFGRSLRVRAIAATVKSAPTRN